MKTAIIFGALMCAFVLFRLTAEPGIQPCPRTDLRIENYQTAADHGWERNVESQAEKYGYMR